MFQNTIGEEEKELCGVTEDTQSIAGAKVSCRGEADASGKAVPSSCPSPAGGTSMEVDAGSVDPRRPHMISVAAFRCLPRNPVVSIMKSQCQDHLQEAFLECSPCRAPASGSSCHCGPAQYLPPSPCHPSRSPSPSASPWAGSVSSSSERKSWA